MFSNVWSENTALFERLMEIHSNSPKLYGFNIKLHPESRHHSGLFYILEFPVDTSAVKLSESISSPEIFIFNKKKLGSLYDRITLYAIHLLINV